MDSRCYAERQKLLRLKWNYHSLTHSIEFYNFYKAETFTDMSLVCQNRVLKCHKLVLYTGSRYFQEQLVNHDGSCHPQFDLAGISFSVMKKVLEFIYNGEVVVGRGGMDEFLGTAQKLKVKGLFNETGQVEMSPLPAPRHSSNIPSKRRNNYTETELLNALQDVQNGMSVLASARAHGIPNTTLSNNTTMRGIRSSFKRRPNGWVNLKNRKYTKEDLDAAVEDVRNGVDGCTAAQARNISRTTLVNNCKKMGVTWQPRIRKGTLKKKNKKDSVKPKADSDSKA